MKFLHPLGGIWRFRSEETLHQGLPGDHGLNNNMTYDLIVISSLIHMQGDIHTFARLHSITDILVLCLTVFEQGSLKK